MNWWALIGSVWTAWWLCISIWITWYDYPRDVNIYMGWMHDASWYWHEMALPIGIWLFGMMCIMLTQLGMYCYRCTQILVAMMKRIEKDL